MEAIKIATMLQDYVITLVNVERFEFFCTQLRHKQRRKRCD